MAKAMVIRPSTGKPVAYTLTQPVADLVEQGKKHGFRNLGTIGDAKHFVDDEGNEMHGDHTPWSRGKLPGWIYAKDTDDTTMPGFEAWLVAKCKSDYDTTWIDFFNINGSQYNNAGTRLQSSADGHFHLSVNKGFEKTHVSLFDDYAHEKESAEMPTVADIMNYKIDSPAQKIKQRSVAEWLIRGAAAETKIDALTKTINAANAADETRDRATLAAINALGAALKGGNAIDTATVVAAIRDEAEKTRAAILAKPEATASA